MDQRVVNKRCSCKSVYPIESFEGYKTCKKCRSRKRPRGNWARLKYMFGITQKEYETLLEKQNGVCAICKQPERVHSNLAVDHDHKFGYTRGLLCFDCNTGIGKLKDDVELLQAAIDYLREWEV